MAETATGQAPVLSRGGNWGDSRFNNFYNRYLGEIPMNTINYSNLSTPERNVDELAAEVAAYLDPQINTLEKNTRRQLRANYNSIDTEGAGRGMSRSTWVTDAKNTAYNAGMSTLSDAYSSYNDALTSGVSERYENYLARKQALDQQNTQNQLEADKYNAQVRTAQEQLAYQRAAEAYNRTKPRSSGRRGGSSNNGGGKVVSPKVATTGNRRMSGQYKDLM